jgi:hypothetical protein
MNKAELLHASRLYKAFRPFYSGIGHVLMFHRVGDNREFLFNSDLMVGTGFLEETLQYFRSHDIDIVSLDECYDRITSGGRTRRFVAITFDDGYRDNLTHALPVLEQYNAPFAVFLTTAFPDHRIVLWWYLLENLVLQNNRVEFEENGASYAYATSTMEEKRDAFWAIRRHIMSGCCLFSRTFSGSPPKSSMSPFSAWPSRGSRSGRWPVIRWSPWPPIRSTTMC